MKHSIPVIKGMNTAAFMRIIQLTLMLLFSLAAHEAKAVACVTQSYFGAVAPAGTTNINYPRNSNYTYSTTLIIRVRAYYGNPGGGGDSCLFTVPRDGAKFSQPFGGLVFTYGAATVTQLRADFPCSSALGAGNNGSYKWGDPWPAPYGLLSGSNQLWEVFGACANVGTNGITQGTDLIQLSIPVTVSGTANGSISTYPLEHYHFHAGIASQRFDDGDTRNSNSSSGVLQFNPVTPTCSISMPSTLSLPQAKTKDKGVVASTKTPFNVTIQCPNTSSTSTYTQVKMSVSFQGGSVTGFGGQCSAANIATSSAAQGASITLFWASDLATAICAGDTFFNVTANPGGTATVPLNLWAAINSAGNPGSVQSSVTLTATFN